MCDALSHAASPRHVYRGTARAEQQQNLGPLDVAITTLCPSRHSKFSLSLMAPPPCGASSPRKRRAPPRRTAPSSTAAAVQLRLPSGAAPVQLRGGAGAAGAGQEPQLQPAEVRVPVRVRPRAAGRRRALPAAALRRGRPRVALID
jgi:hypothetical protein